MTLSSMKTKNPDLSTGPLVYPFAHSIAPLTRLLTHSQVCKKHNDQLTIFAVFSYNLDHSACGVKREKNKSSRVLVFLDAFLGCVRPSISSPSTVVVGRFVYFPGDILVLSQSMLIHLKIHSSRWLFIVIYLNIILAIKPSASTSRLAPWHYGPEKKLKFKCKYWASCLSICSFDCTAHSFACSLTPKLAGK